MRLLYFLSIAQLSLAVAFVVVVLNIGPVCEMQTWETMKAKLSKHLSEPCLTIHLSLLFPGTPQSTQQPLSTSDVPTTSTSEKINRKRKNSGVEQLWPIDTLMDLNETEYSQNLTDHALIKEIMSKISAEANHVNPRRTIKKNEPESQKSTIIPLNGDGSSASQTTEKEQSRVSEKSPVHSHIGLKAPFYSEHKICTELNFSATDSGKEEPEGPGVLVNRLSYAVLIVMIGATIAFFHGVLRAVNKMPLSTCADVFLSGIELGCWLGGYVCMAIVQFSWSDAWADFPISPEIPNFFFLAEGLIFGAILVVQFEIFWRGTVYKSLFFSRAYGGYDLRSDADGYIRAGEYIERD